MAKKNNILPESDADASNRKKDHIDLAFQSKTGVSNLDKRFYYEPILAAHPAQEAVQNFPFLGKKTQAPIWVSSMTGGTEKAFTINQNLAKACKEFGMGMGLGSCRALLYSDTRLKDFDFRKIIGKDLPFYANLGIAQVEQLLEKEEEFRISTLIKKLDADGLIVHINPLQEWLQPEGDRFVNPPLKTLELLLKKLPKLQIIVKEVGQGFGPQSLKELLQLPLAAIEFGAAGGTNFAKLEILRDKESVVNYAPLANIGHSAEEMVNFVNELKQSLGKKCKCRQIIISGGIQNFLDGYYLINKIKMPAVYGQASAFLKHAQGDYQQLHDFVQKQVEGYQLAKAFLKVR